MFAESQPNSLSSATKDYGNFAMVYLTNSGQPMIIGEVWQFADLSPSTSFPNFVWGSSWTCPCLTTSNYMNLVKLTMSWSGGKLNWLANIGGVDYSLFSYTPDSSQEQTFHIGVYMDNCDSTCTTHKDAWLQFGVMTQQIPQSSWDSYIGVPQYRTTSTSQWTQVGTASWLGGLPWTNNRPVLVGHLYSVGTNQGV